MEIVIAWRQFKANLSRLLAGCVFSLLFSQTTLAQPALRIYTIKAGKMYIELSRNIGESDLDAFIQQFSLSDLSLKKFIRENFTDSIKSNGWTFEKNNEREFAISKPMSSSNGADNKSRQLISSIYERFPAQAGGILSGYNRFKNKKTFAVSDSVVTFYLRNHSQAKRVMLAGSFNAFSPQALPMQKTDSGWIANVKLGPGKYWYKFIINDNWRIDEDNQRQENDAEGNTNSVYYKTNVFFKLAGYAKTKKLFVSGSFNNWQEHELLMQQTSEGWQLPLYLAEGTHTYRFIADGKWFEDPANPAHIRNEFGEFNSVIALGTPYLFRLQGFLNARKVLVTGSFNNWRKDELFMSQKNGGWELMYTLGAGNYEYRFIVDGGEIPDPVNPPLANPSPQNANSVLILKGNYTFKLKGFENARQVFLAGSFNDFNPESFAMKKERDEWIFTVHLDNGKCLYKYVVDGKWIIDPENKLWEQNEYGTGNSILWFNEQIKSKTQIR